MEVNDEGKSKFNEWSKDRIELCMERIEFRKEINNLKKINDERVKQIKKLKCEKDLRRAQGGVKQDIKEEIQDVLNN